MSNKRSSNSKRRARCAAPVAEGAAEGDPFLAAVLQSPEWFKMPFYKRCGHAALSTFGFTSTRVETVGPITDPDDLIELINENLESLSPHHLVAVLHLTSALAVPDDGALDDGALESVEV